MWENDIDSSFITLSALEAQPFTWGSVETEIVSTSQDGYLLVLTLEIPSIPSRLKSWHYNTFLMSVFLNYLLVIYSASSYSIGL